MSSLDTALSFATSVADGFRADSAIAIKSTRGRGGRASMAPGDAMSRNTVGRGVMNSRDHELYRKFKDHVYTSIRPVATRIAGQSMNVGRMKSQTAKKAIDAARRGELFSLKQSLPSCFKALGDNLGPIENHKFIEVMRKPNDLMVGWSHLFVSVASLQITGKCHWWLDVKEDGGLQVWYLPSHWLEPIHQDGVLNHSWKLTLPQLGRPIFIPGELMCFFNYPDPADPLNSLSPVQMQAKAVETDEQIQLSQCYSMRNGIRPGVIFKAGRMPGPNGGPGERIPMTPDQRAQLITAIQFEYEGVSRHGHPFIVDQLIDEITPYTLSPSEMDWLDSSALTKSRIMQGIGTNPIIAGEIEGANRASAAVADENFISNVINPLITLMSQVMTVQIGPLYGEGNVIWFDEARARDQELFLREYEFGAAQGVVTGNEIRMAVLNLPPRPDCEELIKINEPPPAKEDNPLSGEDKFDQSSNSNARNDKKPKPKPKPGKRQKPTAEDRKKKAFDGLTLGDREVRSIKSWKRSQKSAESALRKDIESYFTGQLKSVSESIDALSVAQLSKATAVDSVFDTASWDTLLRGVVTQPLLKAATDGAVNELKSVSSRKAIIRLSAGIKKEIRAFITQAMAQDYWADIQDETRHKITKALQAGVEDGGLSHKAIKSALEKSMGKEAASRRATNIARTETAAAMNHGHFVTMEDLESQGIITGKQWLSLLGARDSHGRLHGVVVKVGTDFNVGGHSAPYPGHYSLPAGERCRCRCTIISVIATKSAASTEPNSSPSGTKYNPYHDHLGRFANGPSRGRGGVMMAPDTGSGGGGGGGGSPRTKEQEARDKRVADGLKHHKPVTGAKKAFAVKQESQVAKATGGTRVGGSQAMDVLTKLGKVGGKRAENLLEVKTLCDTKNSKVNVKTKSVQRKFDWMKKKSNRDCHMVVFDMRDKFEGGKHKKHFSGHRVYYRRGVGAYHTQTMHKVKNMTELKRLIGTPTAKLPKLAKPDPSGQFDWR